MTTRFSLRSLVAAAATAVTSSTTSLVPLLFLAALTTTMTTTTTVFVQADGLQSGPSAGSFYSGSMVFGKGSGKLYMTGIHYNSDIPSSFAGTNPATETSNCFVASMPLSYTNTMDDWRSDMVETNYQETCNTLAVHEPSHVVVLGTKELSPTSAIKLEGFLSVPDKNSLGNLLDETTFVGKDNAKSELVYPVAIAVDSDFVYIASLTSNDNVENSSNEKYPNWLRKQKYGSSFDMHVTKLKLSQSGGNDSDFDGIQTGSITVTKEWTAEFPLDPSNETPPPRVYIGGIIHKKTETEGNDVLIVTGSTRGQGPGYGSATGDDEDGFVTVLDPSTGDSLGDGVREGSAKDDVVMGVCDDPNDPKHFFIVGATEGDIGTMQSTDMSETPSQMLSPFVRQVIVDRSSNNNDNTWTLQWAVLPSKQEGPIEAAYGSAIGCVVDEDYIYVAGTIDNGASIVQGNDRKKSQGGDDVWVTKIDKTTQEVIWLTQLGSSGNDRLAPYGGIAIDNSGNPIIYGDTNGSIYRARSSSEDSSVEDMFVMSLNGETGSVSSDDSSRFFGGISNADGIISDDAPMQEPTWSPTYYPTDDQEDDTDKIDGALDDDDDDDDDDALDDDDDDALDDDDDDALDDDDDEYIDMDDGSGYNPIGLQIAGPAYAGGIAYNKYDNTVLLTGGTYMDAKEGLNPTSLCFTGLVSLDDGNLKIRTPRGSQNLEEACSAVAFDKYASYAIGNAETDKDGLFAENTAAGDLVGSAGGAEWVQGQSDAESGGLILQMNKDVQLLGGNRIVDYPAVYPVSVVTNPHDKRALLVASMATKNTAVNEKYMSTGNFPNYLAKDNRKYGSEFFLLINQYQIESVPGEASPAAVPDDEILNTLRKNWFVDFHVDPGGTLEVGGMIMAGLGRTLVVVGSTRDSGGPFGTNIGEDMDGFILKVNPEDGQLQTLDRSKSSTRLDSSNQKDDWILNVCADRFNPDSFYVVGKTMGKIREIPDDEQPPEGSVHAYIAKVDLESLNAVWLKHFTMQVPGGGPTNAEALACSVTHKDQVYVGGTIKDGAFLKGRGYESTSAHGKDDIFLASMKSSTGEVNWIQQMGTSENDRLACGQGLDFDRYGNAIVYGETGGDFYDQHEGGSDVPDLVVFNVDKTSGIYLTPRTEGEGVGKDDPGDQIVGDDHPDNGKDQSSKSEWFRPKGNMDTKLLAIVIGTILSLIVATFLCVCFMRCHKKKKSDLEKQKSIFTYLQQFNVEDIDLRKSPPGGWHGSYLNKLAHGVNTAAQMEASSYKDEYRDEPDDDSSELVSFSPARFAQSSVTKESLFVGNDSKPALGSGGYHDDNVVAGTEEIEGALATRPSSFSIL